MYTCIYYVLFTFLSNRNLLILKGELVFFANFFAVGEEVFPRFCSFFPLLVYSR